MLNLSIDQKIALEKILSWFKKKECKSKQFITLGGYAGTGKTTLISKIRDEIFNNNKNIKVAFITYTGKASIILRSKLSNKKNIDFIGTIHSLIYSPIENDKGIIIGWEKKNLIEEDLIIIDEASMIDKEIWYDLLSYKKPIIAIGDHGQLPPVKGKFNLMENPEIKINYIHRQVANNPIIKISIMARKIGYIPYKKYSSNVIKLKKGLNSTRKIINDLLKKYDKDTLIICGYNKTRVNLNNYIRKILNINDPDPKKGDRVICLRNNHKKGIFNGMQGNILRIEKENNDWYRALIKMDFEDFLYEGLISKKQFMNPNSMNFTKERLQIMKGDLFDFGYALTVHKAQGSQAKRVILIEESFNKNDLIWKKWLYTAVTRAEEELYIVG